MDKKSFIGMILIFLIVSIWISTQKPTKIDTPIDEDSTRVDTVRQRDVPKDPLISESSPIIENDNTIIDTLEENAFKGELVEAQETFSFQIENKYIIANVSNKDGFSVTNWELKRYRSYFGGNVNLADENGIDLDLTNRDGKLVNFNDYDFFVETPINNGGKIKLDEDNPYFEFEFYLPVDNGRIVKRLKFFHNKYSFDLEIEFQQLQEYIINRRYYLSWGNGLPSTEENRNEDFSYSRAFVSMADELDNLDVSKEKTEQQPYNGTVDWAAIKTKYFLAALIPHSPGNVSGALLKGEGIKDGDDIKKVYSVSLEANYEPSPKYVDSYTVYIGPLEYSTLKSYDVNLQSLVMNNGWYEALFRPIALLILPLLKVLYSFIPNYGFVIIVFSILIKLILHPLTKKSHKSMSEMQYFQPKIAELREKYKDEPQRMNKEMMKFYKAHGINPLGGCLPTLLQMPLLFALFIVFRSTIQLRDQPFILWITDLSRPDELFLGFNLPMIGDNIHILPILMAVTMIWQSKMTITDPKQKMMAYFMPAFMLFIFYSFPSGLNLYYTLFNLLTMIQTKMIKKKMHPGKEPSTSKQTPEKKSLPQKKSKKSKPK